MTAWASGYVSDIDYIPGFYAEQMPAHLDLVCLTRGFQPPRQIGEVFTYCELGCGLGETALTLAACHPEAEVHAFDFNPGHIAYAETAARRAGIGNIRFAERAFSDLARLGEGDLPLFDYVTLHGIWTWIGREQQEEIIAILERFVRPGGVVAVTYNALPAWNHAKPIQRLLYDFSTAREGRSDERIETALHFVQAVLDAGSPHIKEDFLQALFGKLDNGRPYLAHEYLNSSWNPTYHVDLADDMARAKLAYIGSATIMENFPAIFLSERQRQLVAAAPARLRETLRDHFTPRPFRRDVFVRGPRILPPLSQARLCDSRRLTLARNMSEPQLSLSVPTGDIELTSPFYGFMIEALVRGDASLAEIKAMPDAPPAPPVDEILAVGLETRMAVCLERTLDDADRQRIREVNLAFVRHAIDNGWTSAALAAAGVGSGVRTSLLGMLCYEALATGTPDEREALAEAALALLLGRGEHLREGERVLDTREDLLPVFLDHAERLLSSGLPVWRRIGAF